MKATYIATAVLLFSGCTERVPRESGPPSPPLSQADGAPLGQTEEPGSRTPPNQIQITESEGLPGYPAGSPFDIDLLQQALPGYQVVEAVASSEGMEWTVLHVLDNGAVVLQIDPDPAGGRLGSLQTSSESVVTDTGHGVGSEFGWIFAEFEPTGCEPGMEEWSGKVVCPAPESARFRYLFEGTWNGPDGELPPLEELSRWKVKTVVWSPG